MIQFLRSNRSALWLLIPLGWVLVAMTGGWLVFPMVLLTVFIGTGFRTAGCSGRRLRHGQREQLPAPARGLPADLHRPVDLAKPADLTPRADQGPARPQTLAELADDDRLPQDVRDRALQLDRDGTAALTYLRERGADAREIFDVEQLVTDFGPQAVRSYLALAPGAADTEQVLDGKTGRQLVVEQLDLLIEQTAARMRHAARLGSDQLLANHRFLTEKFGGAKDPGQLRL
ncbi:hypothetical protein HJ588_04205 [Flexivirga sp. ID2601S]|uniref:Uncharacterized protein n=1 Tax=Flexivirga aerilata TaxID=1656889 RepID=A0A849AF03_9MICO|nr:hypothetical protein [Flexivirga aerilata]NNG38477.1 hypothetical protein [Flexivirga aerilata]